MKNLLLILLIPFVLNAQFLELMQEENLIELNSNLTFSNWNYTELITNGTVESGNPSINSINFTYYSASGTSSTEQYYEGTKSFKITATLSGATARFIPNSIALNGKIVKVSCYVYIPLSVNLTSLKLQKIADGVTSTVAQTTTKGGWVKLEGIYQHGSIPSTDRDFFFEYNYTGTTESFYVDNISLHELVAPAGFVSVTMGATNYVVQNNGCEFVETTGTTYIETSSALKKGTRKFKVTQDWTQGRLSISNGTTSVNLNQSDGTQTVSLYFDGTQKMKIECTNNTISIISYLSIK